jgi:uncharacterized protein YndB with AHSA1/START domain
MTEPVHITADATLPIVRITRDFRATPAQIVRAHTDPELFARWIGPDRLSTRIEHWDARRGGGYRYVAIDEDGSEYAFYGSFHDITAERLVQTFTFEGYPDGVSLDTMTFEELGNGVTRMHAQSLVESLEARDQMLASGMEVGVTEGYRTLDGLIADGAIA